VLSTIVDEIICNVPSGSCTGSGSTRSSYFVIMALNGGAGRGHAPSVSLTEYGIGQSAVQLSVPPALAGRLSKHMSAINANICFTALLSIRQIVPSQLSSPVVVPSSVSGLLPAAPHGKE
jgi:hypothetical protein